MDFKGALLKGMKEIPSSLSPKLNSEQPCRPRIKPQQISILQDSLPELNPRQSQPDIEIQPLSWTKLIPRERRHGIQVDHISSQRPIPKNNIQQSSFSILKDPSMEKINYRNWLDLPLELMESIMQRIGWYDVLMNAKNVCKSWHKICQDMSAWQVIEIRQEWNSEKVRIFFGEHAVEIDCQVEGVELVTKLAMHVIDLSSGQLVDLCIHGFASKHLLEFICRSSHQLRRLRLEFCNYDYSYCLVKPPDHFHIFNKALIEMLRNLPLLEELQFLYTWITVECIEVAGRCCPHLKSFTLNESGFRYSDFYQTNNAHALAIVRNMPRLSHLQLIGNRMTDRGLKAILNHCHFLEYLDIRECHFLRKAVEEEANLARKLRQDGLNM